MKDFRIVFKFYFLKHFRSKAFMISTLLMCIASIASIVVLGNSMNKAKKEILYIVDRTVVLNETWDSKEYGEYINSVILDFSMLNSKKTDAELLQTAKEDNISIAIFDEDNTSVSINVIDEGKISYTDINLIHSTIKQIIQLNRIKEMNLSENVLLEINPEIQIKFTNPKEMPENYMAIFVLFLMMIVFIILYSNSASSDISYLKTNRVMDIFSTSVKPLPLYLGVNIASSLIPFIQLIIIAFCTFVTKRLVNLDFDQITSSMGINFEAFQMGSLVAYILLFLLGFFVYSLINTAIVSIISKVEDITAISVPIALIGLLQYFIGIMIISGDSTVIKIFSYFPLTSPSIMFLRYSFGFVGIIQVIISMAILLITICILAYYGAQIFTHGMIYYGNLKEFNLKHKKYKSNNI